MPRRSSRRKRPRTTEQRGVESTRVDEVQGKVIQNINVGDFLSRVRYYQVMDMEEGGHVFTLENTDGFEIVVDRCIIEAEMESASDYGREQTLAQTALAEVFQKTGKDLFTVCFQKKLKVDDVASQLAGVGFSDLDTSRGRRELAQRLLQGEERIMKGYRIKIENGLGRSLVMDLEKQEPRLVDHRTVQWFIWKGTKYQC